MEKKLPEISRFLYIFWNLEHSDWLICKSHDIKRDFVRVQAYGHYNLMIRIYGHQNVVSFSEISWDFGMKRDMRESSWCLWCLWHHELSRISRFMPKSREIWLIVTFRGLKIGPLLRKLQAFKDWQFFDFY